jgi:alpha-L-fucosidase
MKFNLVIVFIFTFCNSIFAQKMDSIKTEINETSLIKNADFETGTLQGWKHWRTRQATIVKDAFSGIYAVKIGPDKGLCNQEAKVKSNALYRLSAYVKTESGAEEVQLIVSNHGGAPKTVSSSITSYTKISLEFQTAYKIDSILISFSDPSGAGNAFVDQVELTYLGEAPKPKLQEFISIKTRIPKESVGITQLENEKMNWFLNDKFGMFIHWGVYSAMPEGSEWVRHQEGWSNEYYMGKARDHEKGFTAAKYNPNEWAALAKKAGMKYTVLTARHHDGYALFESEHPSSWTSKKDLGRDLIKEYTNAARAAGLGVGLYYSPVNWRYEGFYDPFGNNCLQNVFGYKTAEWHKEDARIMKEEVYEQVTKLLKDYGKINYIFWDGVSLGQIKNKALSDSFWNPGKYQNPNSLWPVNEKYIIREDSTGKALGIMGLARKYQPDMMVNERVGWIGDLKIEEGGSYSSGNINNTTYMEKCVSLQRGGWGFKPNSRVYSFEEVAKYLSNCVVRNSNLLLNVSPDREGVIPQNQQEVLFKMGDWLNKVGKAIYNTRGGPWQPMYGEFGFTYREKNIYCHIYNGYRELQQGTFTTQSLGNKKVVKVINLYDGKELKWVKNKDNTVTISGVDYTQNAFTTILEITLKDSVY